MNRSRYNDNRNVIYGALRRIRKQQGLTQEQVVARLQVMNVNIDQPLYSKIERNQRLVTDFELACLCRALHVTERDLLADFYTQYPES